jgi:hypothetical protein
MLPAVHVAKHSSDPKLLAADAWCGTCCVQAAVKEREGDHLAAISLYLKGGLPARAAQVRLQQMDSRAFVLLIRLVIPCFHIVTHTLTSSCSWGIISVLLISAGDHQPRWLI